ncbi:hypothetical protein ACFX19_002349 [Malus domestica]
MSDAHQQGTGTTAQGGGTGDSVSQHEARLRAAAAAASMSPGYAALPQPWLLVGPVISSLVHKKNDDVELVAKRPKLLSAK